MQKLQQYALLMSLTNSQAEPLCLSLWHSGWQAATCKHGFQFCTSTIYCSGANIMSVFARFRKFLVKDGVIVTCDDPKIYRSSELLVIDRRHKLAQEIPTQRASLEIILCNGTLMNICWHETKILYRSYGIVIFQTAILSSFIRNHCALPFRAFLFLNLTLHFGKEKRARWTVIFDRRKNRKKAADPDTTMYNYPPRAGR